MEKNIKVCYTEEIKIMLSSVLDTDIKKMENLKDNLKSGEDIDINKLPGAFHYYSGIENMIKAYKDVKEEIEKSPECE